jgi:hypothetical protein
MKRWFLVVLLSLSVSMASCGVAAGFVCDDGQDEALDWLCEQYLEAVQGKIMRCWNAQRSYFNDRFARALAEQLSLALREAGELESASAFAESVVRLSREMERQEQIWDENRCGG